jgi:hypothetical protein
MRSVFPKLNLSKSLYTKGLQCKKANWIPMRWSKFLKNSGVAYEE